MDRKNSPLVSVIIPTAHRSSFIILRAIFSVLGQNYPVFEVILVDDNTEFKPKFRKSKQLLKIYRK